MSGWSTRSSCKLPLPSSQIPKISGQGWFLTDDPVFGTQSTDAECTSWPDLDLDQYLLAERRSILYHSDNHRRCHGRLCCGHGAAVPFL